MDDEQFLNQVLSSISEAEIITIFFPLLRRALLVDTRHTPEVGHMVRIVPQVSSMEERIASIERLRPQFGNVRAILGIPWIKSVNTLREQGVIEQVVKRLQDADMPSFHAQSAMEEALKQLSRIEHSAFLSMIRGDGYQTIWSAEQ